MSYLLKTNTMWSTVLQFDCKNCGWSTEDWGGWIKAIFAKVVPCDILVELPPNKAAEKSEETKEKVCKIIKRT